MKPLLHWRQALLIGVLVSGVVLYYFIAEPRRPNILFITLDTTRADRIGCYGYEAAQTPVLDELSRRGVRFERAYVSAPMTAPSHTSIFTGLWPPEHGVYTNGHVSLEAGIPTLAEILQRHNYDTAAFVAAFVLTKKFGLDRGFGHYDDDLSQAADEGDVLHRYRDGQLVIDSAISWLTRRRARSNTPFFCWVHLYDPHDPYLDHAEIFGDKFQGRPYDAEIAYVDQQIGRLVDTLSQLSIREQTVVVVVGDHGESLGEHGEKTHGYTLHDSTLRVPLIIADPRSSRHNQTVATPVSSTGLFPTLLELAGAPVPTEFSSRTLSPAIGGHSLPSQACYSQTEEPYLQAFWSPLQSWTTDRWRYVRTTKPELYDLVADPQELINLAADQPDRVSELDGELSSFESRFKRRDGARVALSDREQQALKSLGYTGSSPGDFENRPADREFPDVKDMLPYLEELQEATHRLDAGDHEGAAELLEPLARDVPNFLRARLNLGLCRLHQENYEDAVRWLKAALEIDPQSDRGLDMLGFAYLKLNQFEPAEEQFRRLLELQPDSENGHLFLGEIAQRRRQFPLALRHYLEVLRINPQNQSARQVVTEMRAAGVRP